MCDSNRSRFFRRPRHGVLNVATLLETVTAKFLSVGFVALKSAIAMSLETAGKPICDNEPLSKFGDSCFSVGARNNRPDTKEKWKKGKRAHKREELLSAN